VKEDLMQRKRKYLLMPKKELTERCLLIEEEIERSHSIIKEVREDLYNRLDKIKDYLKQVHIETQKGILSSNNLIFENIERLCEGKEILKGEE
jgi:aspartate/tyrosine/aromatic aminotransferase